MFTLDSTLDVNVINLRWQLAPFERLKFMQLDIEVKMTQTTETNKHPHSISFVCFLLALLPSSILICQKEPEAHEGA